MIPLARLRLRLTLLYLGVFTLILGLLGGGLFLTVRRQMSRQLDVSLKAATAALERAAQIREAEQANARGAVVDAVDELHVPGRTLYLFDDAGQPIKPAAAPPWVQDAARTAAQDGRADREWESPNDFTLRLHAERFKGNSGSGYVAVAVADRVELEDQYSSLIETFAAAALVALLLVAGGGYLLVRKSTAPVERSMDQMRRFMADAAHELRTPITLLRTRTEVALSQDREAARDATTLRAIDREAAQLGKIVGDLLTLARADAGERTIAHAPVYLDDVAAEAVEAVRTLAEQKRVAIAVGRFEEARLTGDAALVRQLLVIVLDNAVKFTPGGGKVTLDVATEDGKATVVIADSGIGIPAEQLPRVFERFYRGDPARREADGAGLGLAIARWIADAHGARIDLASPPDGGTRVTIIFPLAA